MEIRSIIFASVLTVTPTAMTLAENNQTVTIDGLTANKEATDLTFSGDDVTLTFSDGSTQTTDMEGVSISLTYNLAGINAIDSSKTDKSKQSVHAIDGRYISDKTSGLAKGLYIVDGKKIVLK